MVFYWITDACGQLYYRRGRAGVAVVAITPLPYTNAWRRSYIATVGALWAAYFSHVENARKRNGAVKFA